MFFVKFLPEMSGRDFLIKIDLKLKFIMDSNGLQILDKYSDTQCTSFFYNSLCADIFKIYFLKQPFSIVPGSENCWFEKELWPIHDLTLTDQKLMRHLTII